MDVRATVVVLVAAVCTLAPNQAGEASWAGVPDGAQPHPPASVAKLEASTDFDAPASLVLSIFGDVANYPRIFKSVRRASVDAADSEGRPTRFFVELDLGWPVGPRWMRGRTSWTADTVKFHRTAGTILSFEGKLAVSPRGKNRSHLEYRAWLDAGPPSLPSWLGNLLEQAIMPGIVADARRFVSRHSSDDERPAELSAGKTSGVDAPPSR